MAEAREVALLSMQDPNTPDFDSDNFHADVIPPLLAKPANFRRKSNILSVAVTAVVLPGLFATMALPAYGAAAEPTAAQGASAALSHHRHAQTFVTPVAASAALDIHRDAFGATSVGAAQRKHAMLAALAGPSLAGFLANPPYPKFSLSQVVKVAQQYEGVPYVFGGESPAGFDCSGLVAYVYAQFGIALPHSAAEQGAIGTKISRAAAQPGDVVVMDGGSHVGIYIGGGRMIDAPEPGRVVSNDAIYDNDYYFVRFGI